MGSDSGPHVILEASLCALKADQTLFFFFVGDKTVISNILSQPLFKQLNADQLRSSQYEIVHAQQEITMQVKPSAAFRKKDSSSMGIALQLVASGKAQGCVSSGNTAALVLLARHYLNMFADVDRPAISTVLPSEKGFTRVLDLGASIDCDSQALYYFAIMGSVVAETVDKISSPKVGLLNIGVEEVKGNDKVKQASIMLQQVEALNYSGFVEGNDIYSGKIDVVVCDGFVGNAVLKASEGLTHYFAYLVNSKLLRGFRGKIMQWLLKPALKHLKDEINPDRYNGASFVGLEKVVVKSHGAANAVAVGFAISEAVEQVRLDVPHKIKNALEGLLNNENQEPV
ncbi:MAG TPA: phosphate acyltransferase PlsX [Aeromonadales bacterium]|nr:phosphate acyltransferase PlsX [Aeromonadales bacterium]